VLSGTKDGVGGSSAGSTSPPASCKNCASRVGTKPRTGCLPTFALVGLFGLSWDGILLASSRQGIRQIPFFVPERLLQSSPSPSCPSAYKKVHWTSRGLAPRTANQAGSLSCLSSSRMPSCHRIPLDPDSARPPRTRPARAQDRESWVSYLGYATPGPT